MKKKKLPAKKAKNTFKLQSPNGSVHELDNSHRPAIEDMMANGGDVDSYVMKYGGLAAEGQQIQDQPVQQAQGDQDQAKMQQVMQEIAQALQQGHNPKEIQQMLVKEGVPAGMAHHLINQVMTQDWKEGEQEPAMKKGGKIRKAALGTPIGTIDDMGNQMGVDQNGAPISMNPAGFNNQNFAGMQQNVQPNTNIPFTIPGGGSFVSGPGQVIPPTEKITKKQGAVNQAAQTGTVDQSQVAQGKKDSTYNPYKYYGLPYHAAMSEAWGDEIGRDKQSLSDAQDSGDAAGVKTYKTQLTGDKMSVAGHAIAGAFQTTTDVLGPWSAAVASKRAMNDELRMKLDHQREMAEVLPSRGDNSQLGGGTNAAYTKYGKRILKHGGILDGLPTKGSDFASTNPNVKTEKDEVVADAATGAVVKEDGVLHTDPSGGNSRTYSQGSTVITDSVKTPVKEFVKEFIDMPDIANRIVKKYKDPDKEVMHADIANLFNTKELSQDLAKVGKKMTKEEGYLNPVETDISQTTSKLNLATLARKKKQVEDEIARNNAIVRGPLFDFQEKIKKTDPADIQAKFGKKIKRMGTGGYVNGKWVDDVDQSVPEQDISMLRPTVGDAEADPKDLSLYKALDLTQRHPQSILDAYPEVQRNIPFNTGQVEEGNRAAPIVSSATAPTVVTPSTAVITSPVKKSGIQFVKPHYGESTTTAGLTTPTGRNLHVPGSTDIEWMNWQNKVNKDPQLKSTSGVPMLTSEDAKRYGIPDDPQSLYNASYQEQYYDQQMETPEGRAALAQMWDLTGNTKKGIADGIKFPSGNLSELNDEDLKKVLGNLRPAYVDSKLEIRKNNPVTSPEAVRKAAVTGDVSGDFKGITLKDAARRTYYQEGLNPWQTAGEMATLLDPYEAAPYIEDLGSQNALAASTRKRFTDIQPGINRNMRALRAQTRHSQDASADANAYSNAYTANNELEGTKAANDANIEHAYNQEENRLREAAGTKHASALDLSAVRSAKGHSAFTDRWINALSGIGTKKTANEAENRAAVLYQDMFPDFGYNPISGTGYRGNINLSVGGPRNMSGSKDELEKELIRDRIAKEEYRLKHFGEKNSKYGSKVKKLPKKKAK